ncbi:MAG: hypothetical protein IPP74_14435 [Alphaproteobacteria bacterium]|nr:hypothetical protein [Alphaproteobacteria bacterium]
MNISTYVLGLAELLEKGALTVENLKKEDHPMQVIAANILRKALNSSVMTSVAEDFHAAFNQLANEKQMLTAKVQELLGKAPAEDSTMIIKDRSDANKDPSAAPANTDETVVEAESVAPNDEQVADNVPRETK